MSEKVLQEINGKKTIEILLDHVIPHDDKYRVILAIPESSENNILAEIGKSKGVEVYRGQDESPLHRIYECALMNEFQYVVRITADDILIDQQLMREQIKFHIRGGQDYTYLGKCPEGIAGEVISFDALSRVVDMVGNKPVEFVSYYLRTNDFSQREFYPPFDYQFSFRLTLDYEEDLILLKTVFSLLKEPFGTLDIINLLKRNKYLLQINKLPETTLYTCNYNQGKYVVECMESIMSQTYQDFEYIIVDDSSTDDGLKTVMDYYSSLPTTKQRRVRVIRNSDIVGLPASCNRVLEMARGKYIMRIDADDKLKPESVRRTIDEIKILDVKAIFTGYQEMDAESAVIRDELNNPFHPGCCLLSKWAVNELKYREGIKYMEGADFFNRFKKLYNYKVIPDLLWYYRRHDEQKTAQEDHPEKGEKS